MKQKFRVNEVGNQTPSRDAMAMALQFRAGKRKHPTGRKGKSMMLAGHMQAMPHPHLVKGERVTSKRLPHIKGTYQKPRA